MTIKKITLSPPQVKRKAKELVQACEERGEEMIHKKALNLIAQEQGIAEGWQAYKQAWKNREK